MALKNSCMVNFAICWKQVCDVLSPHCFLLRDIKRICEHDLQEHFVHKSMLIITLIRALKVH